MKLFNFWVGCYCIFQHLHDILVDRHLYFYMVKIFLINLIKYNLHNMIYCLLFTYPIIFLCFSFPLGHLSCFIVLTNLMSYLLFFVFFLSFDPLRSSADLLLYPDTIYYLNDPHLSKHAFLYLLPYTSFLGSFLII